MANLAILLTTFIWFTNLKKGGRGKKSRHISLGISSEMMRWCLQFFPKNVTLTHMEISHTLYLLMNLSLAIKPNNMSLDFLSNSRAWWRCLQNSFQQSFIHIWKYFSLKLTPQESIYKPKIVVTFFFFSWIQLRLKNDFLSKTLIFEYQNKFMWHYCPLRLALLFTHPKGCHVF